MKKYICVHGHFYQPPRENPWLEAVELQDSAAPYHDWNERITAECYAPNAFARFLDGSGKIENIVSNYSRMSFNFGPTLLSWLKSKFPAVHQAIVEADKESQKKFSGHGSALAQVYNHMIMPLASKRDKQTQVLWGIADFESRFGRKPEGMWLAETGADDESLDALAGQGIKFTILSPFQASKMKPLDGKEWQDVNGGKIDPSMPYLVKLPSGRRIAVFFYDLELAKAVAFEHLLSNGETMAKRMMGAFDDKRGRDQIVNIATDGESYGHHFANGDMALAYALRLVEKEKWASLTVYGEYLEKYPPTHEVQIHQGSAWSCSHGVDRWRKDCGCNSGMHPGWNQRWREPLRHAMDWLRDKLAACYEAKAAELLKDPWAARDGYIDVILDRSTEAIDRFFSKYAAGKLDEAHKVNALRLLEMQRHALLMFTSCGWFFDELSGIETVQIIRYAARAIQLAGHFGEDFEPGFLELLEKAESNLPDPHNGRQIYGRYVKPSIMTREFVGAHYAISSFFQTYPEENRIYSFTVKQEDRQTFTADKKRLATGTIKVMFETTRSTDLLSYAVFHPGDQTIQCSVREDGDVEGYKKLVQELSAAFKKEDVEGMTKLMEKHFGPVHYSVEHLFRDEQRRILHQIVANASDEIYATFQHITSHYAPVRRFLADLQSPPIKALAMSTDFVLNTELRRQFEGDKVDPEKVRALLADCGANKVPLYKDDLSYAVSQQFDRIASQFLAEPQNREALTAFVTLADLARSLPFEINLWNPQNIYQEAKASALPKMQECARQGNKEAAEWVQKFTELGDKLGFVAAAPAKRE